METKDLTKIAQQCFCVTSEGTHLTKEFGGAAKTASPDVSQDPSANNTLDI